MIKNIIFSVLAVMFVGILSAGASQQESILLTLGYGKVEIETESDEPIFEDVKTRKFVQFMYLSNDLLCEVPLSTISEDEEESIKKCMTEIHRWGEKSDEASYQKWFCAEEISEATALVEKIFINIFKAPKNYTIKSDLSILQKLPSLDISLEQTSLLAS